MSDPIRIAPAPGANAPALELHDPLCACTECYGERRGQSPQLTIVPFDVQAEGARGQEPVATLTFDGVTVELSLTYLRAVAVSVTLDQRSWNYGSHRVFAAALGEIERRMWQRAGRRAKKVG